MIQYISFFEIISQSSILPLNFSQQKSGHPGYQVWKYNLLLDCDEIIFKIERYVMNLQKRQTLLAAALLPIFSTAWAKVVPHQIWSQLKTLRGVAMQPGMSQPTLYVFIDPNCPVCADLWEKQVNGKPFHELPAIWIPVAYMGHGSLGKAAELIRSGRKEDMQRNFTKFNRSKRQGSLLGVAPTSEESAALATAKALWLELGGATPLFVYRTRQGEARLFLGLMHEPYFTQRVASMYFPGTAP